MLNEMGDPEMPTSLHFDRDGLIPVIMQEEATNDVLMLAFMNEEALQRTLETRLVHFWSRSRQKLWQKGETSGHVQEVVSLQINCENNSLLLRVHQRGDAACHDGYRSCYFRQWTGGGIWEINQPRLFDPQEVYNPPRSAGFQPAHPLTNDNAGPSPATLPRSAGFQPAQRLANDTASRKRQPSRSAGFQPAQPNASTNTSLRNQDASPPDSDVSMRRRTRLPHLEQRNATYFVTFRLADALPAQILLSYEGERAALLKKQRKSRSELSAEEKQRLDKLFSERIQHYLDTGAGACHLANPAVAQIVADALHFFNGIRYRLFCWCIMPNHMHALLQPLGNHKLANILHTWKSFTASEANRLLSRRGEFWQREYYDHLVRDEPDFQRCVEYTLNNPIKANLENWPWVEIKDAHPASEESGENTLATEGRLEAGATDPLAEAFQRIYHAYEYLRDHDLEEVSGTSRRLRHPDHPWLRQRAAQELDELAGVLNGTHTHTNPTDDTILEGRQVCYWLLTRAVAEHLTFEQVMPHIHLRAGFETGKAITESAAELFALEERALLDDLSTGLYLVGGACQNQGVSLLALVEAELEDLQQKSYLPSGF